MATHRRLFFLLIIFLPTQLGLHLWPDWSYVLGRRIDYLSPIFYFTDLLIIGTLVSWWWEQSRSRGHFIKLSRKVIGASGVIVGFIFVNIIFAVSPPVAAYKWIKILEFFCLGYYMIRTKVRVTDILVPIQVAVLYSSVLALIQFLMQHSLGGVFWILGERSFALDTPGIARFTLCLPGGFSCGNVLRAYGTFPHPNVLGGFIAAALPFLIYQMFHLKHSRPLSLTVMVLSLSGLLVTFSRSAWFVGLLVSSITYYILWKKHSTPAVFVGLRQHIIPVLSFCFFIAVLVFFFPSAADESVIRRQELLQAAGTLLLHHPLTGTGLGNFLVSLPGIFSGRAGNFLQPVHNIYMLWIAETGFFGLFGVLFIILFLRKQFIALFHLILLRHDHIVLLLPVTGFLLLGVTDHYPLTLQQGQLFFTLCLSLLLTHKI